MSVALEAKELFSWLPEALASSWRAQRPWEILGTPLDEILAALPHRSVDVPVPEGAHLLGGGIVIGGGSRIAPGAVLEGPVFVGRNVDVRTGAYLRAGVWIGDGCTVGANTEVKRSILLPGASAPHLNYVGDSVLGADVNLGAGTVLSNFRHDGGEISIPMAGDRIATGRRKLGAILGDGVKTGCNSVLHPGVIVGRESEIYPSLQLRAGVYPAFSIVKLRQQIEIVDKR